MDKEAVGNVPQPSQRLVVVPGNGLFAEIAAGHDQGEIRFPHQEVMQRGIGQHHPQMLQTGGHFGADVGLLFLPPEEHYGALW